MLISGSQLIGIPVMGLQTGSKLASTFNPVIDPSNLKILAYQLEGPLLTDNPSFVLIADVRELGNIGMIVDSSDEFVSVSDVISLQKIYELNFKLTGLSVIDDKNHKLGKVSDFVVDTDSFFIQQLNVKQGIIKSLSDTELLIHRKQIIEINDHHIKVKSAAKKLEPITKPSQIDYMNPFKSPKPQVESAKTN